jgi:hypothetical protein
MKKIVERIGMAGVAAIALLAAALAFSNFMVRPLEERNALLKQSASGKTHSAAPSGAKVAAVYAYLQKEEDTTDWLAKLHGIGTATGIQMRAASYSTKPAEGRIMRYEIVLPVAGSYAQIRDFLKRAQAEIPVMSIDQVTLKKDDKKGATPQAALHAELRLTLHMVKS